MVQFLIYFRSWCSFSYILGHGAVSPGERPAVTASTLTQQQQQEPTLSPVELRGHQLVPGRSPAAVLVSLRPELTRLDITPSDSSPGVSLDIRQVHTIQVYEYMGELSGIQSNVNYDVPQNVASLKARSENAIKKPLQLLV